MYSVITDLVKWMVPTTCIIRLLQEESEANTSHLFTRNSSILLKRLLSISISGDLNLSPAAGRQECCRLALLILVHYMTSSVSQRQAEMNMRRMQKALPWKEFSRGSNASDMMLWIFCIGRLTCQKKSGS
jgi:hypothetical protein